MRHLLNPLDFTVEETEQLLDLARDIENNRSAYAHI
jgi:aspartate carbamoyltransferase catalytic subunit